MSSTRWRGETCQCDGSSTTSCRSSAPGDSARTLYFVDLSLPHSPWRFLPSGHEYLAPTTIDWKVTGSDRRDDPWLVQQAYRRHLLQVGYADRLVGRLRDRLVGSGIWNEALVVVTADHGVSFVVGRDGRLTPYDVTVALTGGASFAPGICCSSSKIAKSFGCLLESVNGSCTTR